MAIDPIELKTNAVAGGAGGGQNSGTGTISLQGSGSGFTGLTLTLNPSGGGQVSFNFTRASLQNEAQQNPNGPVAQLLNNATQPGAPTRFQVAGPTLAGLLGDLGNIVGGPTGGGQQLPTSTNNVALKTNSAVGQYTRKKLPGRMKSGTITLTRAAHLAVDAFIKLAQESGTQPGGGATNATVKLEGVKLEAPGTTGTSGGTGAGAGTRVNKIEAITVKQKNVEHAVGVLLDHTLKTDLPHAQAAGGTATGPGALDSAAALAALQLNTPPQSPAGAVINSLIGRLSQGPPGQTNAGGTPPGPPVPPTPPGIGSPPAETVVFRPQRGEVK